MLSHQRTLLENYTIATVFVDKVYNNPKAGKIRKVVKIVSTVLVTVLMVCLTIFFMKYRSNKKNAEQMLTLKERGITYLNELNYAAADGQFDEAVELADKIRAGKNSKMNTAKQTVLVYDAVSGYLTEAEQAVAEGEYKKAANKYGAALGKSEELKNEYGENTDYDKAIGTYKTYAENMRDGTEALSAYNYDAASETFEAAAKAADSIDDTAKRDVANDNLRTVNGEKAMLDAASFESSGQALMDQKLYVQAKTQYQTALELYQLAKEDYNVKRGQQDFAGQHQARQHRGKHQETDHAGARSRGGQLYPEGQRGAAQRQLRRGGGVLCHSEGNLCTDRKCKSGDERRLQAGGRPVRTRPAAGAPERP